MDFLKKILKFNKSQQRGLILLLIILFIIAFITVSEFQSDDFNGILPLTESVDRNIKPKYSISNFYFNPNTVSENELLKLGINKLTIKNIIKFRNRGGKFYIKSDFAKIYTLHDSVYQRLYQYIDLPEQQIKKKSFLDYKRKKDTILKEKECVLVDLNIADTTLLKTIPLIGSKRAQQIIAYRNLLGGFYDLEQLKEVYSINQDVYAQIINHLYIDNFELSKIDINISDLKKIKSHPYLTYKDARNIIRYREIKGKIYSKTELLANRILDTNTYKRIENYLCVE